MEGKGWLLLFFSLELEANISAVKFACGSSANPFHVGF
jgi:hypothetical protein